MCPFEAVTQDHVSLGKWKNWSWAFAAANNHPTIGHINSIPDDEATARARARASAKRVGGGGEGGDGSGSGSGSSSEGGGKETKAKVASPTSSRGMKQLLRDEVDGFRAQYFSGGAKCHNGPERL